MLDLETEKLWLAQRELVGIAERALDASESSLRNGINQLLNCATRLVPTLTEYEGTEDPYELSRNLLEYVAFKDPRVLEGPPRGGIDANDKYSMILRGRQAKFGTAIMWLESFQTRAN